MGSCLFLMALVLTGRIFLPFVGRTFQLDQPQNPKTDPVNFIFCTMYTPHFCRPKRKLSSLKGGASGGEECRYDVMSDSFECLFFCPLLHRRKDPRTCSLQTSGLDYVAATAAAATHPSHHD